MNEDFRSQLMRIVALLEQRHGIGAPRGELPRWLEQRLTGAVQALLVARGIDVASLPEKLEREPELVVELANAVCVGETRFYRDAAQWEALRRSFLPELWARAPERLTALSAGCSTGEEAWTLAMLLSEGALRKPTPAARFGVLGVDRSELALLTARSATYDLGSQRQLPRELAQRFLQPAVDGSLSIVADLQPLVTFRCHDLTLGVPPGSYAVIVCKNVLGLLDEAVRNRLLQALLDSLTDDGILLVARSEVALVHAHGGHALELAPDITAFRAP